MSVILQAKGGNIETVIKIGNGALAGGKRNQGVEHTLMLVDSKDNQFVLARGADSTIPTEDHNLIKVGVWVNRNTCSSLTTLSFLLPHSH